MSKLTGRAFPFGLGALVVATVLAAGVSAWADVTTEEPGSIVVYPKVINAEGRDTVIEIANTGNTLVHAHCFYTNAQLAIPSAPPSPFNQPIWQEVDFFIWLTRQQPSHWIASQGRDVDPFDSMNGALSNSDLDGAGLDPGFIPPVPNDFVGELLCVEIDSNGSPISGNHLKGEATLKAKTGDVSKYAAIAIIGHENVGATGRDLQLDNDQYNSCPNTLLLNFFASGVGDPVIEDVQACEPNTCTISTDLTLVPCQRDYENQIPGTVNVSFFTFNEFENRFSTTTTVTCWLNEDLSQIGSGLPFEPAVLGSLTGYARISPVGNSGGLLGVAEQFHTASNQATAAAAFNLEIEGSRFDPPGGRDIIDHIVLVGE